MDKNFLSALEHELQDNITSIDKVNGGDINEAFILYTGNGKLFLKMNDNGRTDMFEKELKGLDLLRNANAIAVPRPIITGKKGNTIYLLMECINKGNKESSTWQCFGQQIASLHRNTAKQFGLDHDNYIGSLLQQNHYQDNWSEFYATQRILPLIKQAFDTKKCDSSDIRMTERLCNKLEVLYPKEKPSLLHGDLWRGNFMINAEGHPVIYDPAVYYGHREMDIGMSLLFGGFDKSFYSFYNEAFPMEHQWQQRVDLSQLYPLLVHVILFGGHYYHSVRNVLKKYTQ